MHPKSGVYLIDQYQYGIIDRAALLGDELPSSIEVQALVPDLLADDHAKMPGLVWLPGLSDTDRALLQENLDSGFRGERQHLLSCLLACDGAIDPPSMARHLIHCLILESPQGKVFLRYYDPRVFQHLEWILEAPQRRALFGPIERWTVCEPDQPRTVDRPGSCNSQRWFTSAEQRRLLDNVGIINETFKLAFRQRPDLGPDDAAHREVLARRIIAAIDCAEQRYGITQDKDLIIFAVHALLHGEDFHERPFMQTLLASMAENDSTYADACALIDESTWAQEKP
jgi:hypothetical protein